MNNSKRYYLAFVGQNATTGTPHPITGRMSMYGTLKAFSKRSDRDQFVEGFITNGYEFCASCNKFSARKYHMGMSMYVYNQVLDYAISEADQAI